ncbi:hypothetical protein [Nocardioides sp.]|uniref:hypothetical protein n=1 Tax=Nocardioides sp. TaxID=35761 RepID=UPI00356714C5
MTSSRPTSRTGGPARLVAVSMLLAALAMTVVVGLVQAYLVQAAEADATRVGEARVAAVAETLSVRDGEVVAEGASDPLAPTAWVFDASGRLVAGSLGEDGVSLVVRSLGRYPAADARTVEDRVQLVSGSVRLEDGADGADGGPVAVVVAGVDLEPYADGRRRALLVAVVLAALAVLSTGVAAWQAARRSR